MAEAPEEDPQRPLPAPMRDRNPWPMWPIAISILLFMGVYTWVNIEYRKDGPAFEPHQAMQDRKKAVVDKNLYGWYALKTELATDSSTAAPSEDGARQNVQLMDRPLDDLLPDQLKYYMSTRPLLVTTPTRLETPATLTPGENYRLTATLPAALASDERIKLLSFYKEGQLFFILSVFAESKEEQTTATATSDALETITWEIPTTPIAAETIAASLISEGRATSWTIENRDPSAAVETEDRPNGFFSPAPKADPAE